MLLKSNSRTRPEVRGRERRPRPTRAGTSRSRSTFQRSSQSTFMEPGDGERRRSSRYPMRPAPCRRSRESGGDCSPMLHSTLLVASDRRRIMRCEQERLQSMAGRRRTVTSDGAARCTTSAIRLVASPTARHGRRDSRGSRPAARRRAGPGRRPHRPGRRGAGARRLARAPRPRVRGGALRPRRASSLLELDGQVHRLVGGDFALMPTGRAARAGERRRRARSAGCRSTRPQRPIRARDRRDTFFEPARGRRGDGGRGHPPAVRRPDASLGRPLRRHAAAARGARRRRTPPAAARPPAWTSAILAYSGISVKMLVDRRSAPTT